MWTFLAALVIALGVVLHGGIYQVTTVTTPERFSGSDPFRLFRLNRITGSLETCWVLDGNWKCFPIPTPPWTQSN
jgi:hypothetical protein